MVNSAMKQNCSFCQNTDDPQHRFANGP